MSKEDALESLGAIGLTESEARLYLALLGGGADAKWISQAAGVPYSKVHTLLRRLEEKGLVREKGGRPTIYEAGDPRDALERYQKRLADDLSRRVAEAAKAIQALVTVGETEKPDIWIIRGQEEVLRKAYEALIGADEGVKLALPVIPEVALAAFLPILTRLRSEKIPVRLLLPMGVSGEVLARLGALAEIVLRDRMFGGGLIVDDREALLVIGGKGAALDLAIWSNHSGIVDLARTYFDYLWQPSAGP